MVTNHDYRRFAILYVDDETQALKYFRKALEKDFEILTAENVSQAEEVLKEHGDSIGILVCDQRMPGERGTDLLARVRKDRPGIVRVLTTAYSDLDSAIESVNSGAIYKYIVKPWDLRDLRGVLLRAMDFFIIQRQRDALLQEKLSVLQRLMVADRVRSLATLAAGLSAHIRNSMKALKDYLDLMPDIMRTQGPDNVDGESFHNVWESAQEESRRALQMVESIASAVARPDETFDEFVTGRQLVDDAVRNAGDTGATFQVADGEGLPELKVNRETAGRMWRVLINKADALNDRKGNVRIEISGPEAVWGTPGVKFTLRGEGDEWKAPGINVLSSKLGDGEDAPGDLGLGLLSAYFIAHHHGGDIQFVTGDDPRVEVTLPNDPLAAQQPPADTNFLDDLFEMFELQQLNAAE